MTKAAVIIENRFDVSEVIRQHQKFLPPDWLVLHIQNEPVYSMSDYNNLLTSKRFWRNMPDKVLIFQHDSQILRSGIEDFLEWDFIGSPIKHIEGCMNGGLSLRDSNAMLKIINNIPFEGEHINGNEDIYFVNGLRQLSGYLPSKEIAQQFSVETIFGLGSLGYHQIEAWLTPGECEQIKMQYGNNRAS